jgi:phosphoglycolate phosphatase
MRLLKGVIFDLDGTLIDSRPELHRAINSTLKAHGRRAITLEEFKSFYGDGMRLIAQRAFAATGNSYPASKSDNYYQECLSHYLHQQHDPSQVYPGVIDMLESFKEAGIKLGICSLKAEAATLSLLAELGLRNYFAAIGGGDTFPVCKPNPGHLLGVIERIGIPASDCLMIGDGPKDVAMARSAKIPCLIVAHEDPMEKNVPKADGVLRGFLSFAQELKAAGFEF